MSTSWSKSEWYRRQRHRGSDAGHVAGYGDVGQPARPHRGTAIELAEHTHRHHDRGGHDAPRGSRHPQRDALPQDAGVRPECAPAGRGQRVHHLPRDPAQHPPRPRRGSVGASYAILTISSLGFLGLGVQPPSPDWGLMLAQSRQFLGSAPWVALAPAGAIASLVVGVNLVTDGVKQASGLPQEEATT